MKESEAEIRGLFREALQIFAVEPISTKLPDLLDCRMVHDLGIAGDDCYDFFEILNSLKPTKGEIPLKFIPGELSRDAYFASRLSNRFLWVKCWYVTRIKCPPLTVRRMYQLLYGSALDTCKDARRRDSA